MAAPFSRGVRYGPMDSGEPQLTLLDRAICWLAPEWGRSRVEARTALTRKSSGSWHGAARNRPATRGWFPGYGSADEDNLDDLPDARARSRDAIRNQPVATGAISRVVTNTLGANGLRPQSYVDRRALGWEMDKAREWQRSAEAVFREATSTREIDWERVLNFGGLQKLVLRSALESGDCFALKRFRARSGSDFRTKVQVVEADRVENPEAQEDSPTLAGGVEKSPATGEPVAYHISKRHPGDYTKSGMVPADEYVRFPAFGPTSGTPLVMHVFHKDRPGQTRGMPFLAPVIEHLRQISNYGDSELYNAAVSSLFTAIITTPDRSPLPSNPSLKSSKVVEDGDVAMGHGTFVNLKPGEDIRFADPSRPNGNFGDFIQAWMELLGAALDIPQEVLKLSFQSSYTAGRAALLQAVQKWKGIRAWLASSFCQPVWEEVIAEAISMGKLEEPPGFFTDPSARAAALRAEWVGDSFGLLDPQRETAAAVARIEAGLSSLAIEVPAATGRDWEEVHEQRVEEARRRQEDGLGAASSPEGVDNVDNSVDNGPDEDSEEPPDQDTEEESEEAEE